ncbi:acyl-CoA dehydrogenase family protein [Streptomyces sp. B6B3]|uniref:acyl-CoA dehydrogenase family protein n=1 Tax=Streptomyces sp. B6B3 TaxID=3153570 RepID=UPI00325F93F7
MTTRQAPQTLVSYRSAVAEAAAEAADAGLDARGLWRSLGSRGLVAALSSDRPPAFGRGDPHSWVPEPGRLAALLEELDARLPVGLVLSVCVQAASVVPLLAETLGRDAGNTAGDGLLDAALRGDAVVAFAVTDAASAGSDVMGARTAVAGDPPAVTGTKQWITNAAHCDHFLVLARRRAARHFTSFGWVVVPARADGVTVRPVGGQVFPGAGLADVDFASARAREPGLVGPSGRGLALFARHVATERLAGALWSRAVCRRVLAGTREWLTGRPSGDGTLWDDAAIRQRFAACLVEFARLDALCGWATSEGPPTPARAMALKAAVGEGTLRVLRECADLRGADAFRDGGLALLSAQAAMFAVAGGATGALLTGLADHADDLLRP